MGEGVDVGADVVVVVESVVMLLVVLVLTLTEEVDVVLAVVLPMETDDPPVAGANTDKRQLAPHMRVESPAHGMLQSESGSSDAAGSVLPQ
jgi:hypothetical protein